MVIWPKRIVYVIAAAAGLSLSSAWPLPWATRALLVLVPLGVAELVLRALVQARSARFEGELMACVQAGHLDELLPLYRRQHLLRFAAPRHFMLGKLALIFTRRGELCAAAASYREALSDASPAQRHVLALGLARTLCALGEEDEAERAYRLAIDEQQPHASACVELARLLRKRGGAAEEVERYLRQALDSVPNGVWRCELVELLAEQGRLEESKTELSLVEQELAEGNAEHQAALASARRAVKAAGGAGSSDGPASASG